MIDIHTHVLPGVDDGSPDMETSLEALRRAVDAGITDIVCSSHYLRGQYDNPREKLAPKVKELQQQAKANSIPVTLHLGAEVMLDSMTVEDVKNLSLNIDDTRYVLVESEINALPVNYLDIFYNLLRTGWKPIFAHPERYPDIMHRMSMVEDLIHRNVYMQVNAGSLLGGYGARVQETAWKMLEKGYAHFLASDTHCRSKENSLKMAVEKVTERIDGYTAELLTKINPAKMLANEPIDYFYLDLVKEPDKPTTLSRIRDFFLGR